MNLRRLRYFVAVAEELHFGRAAERLHMAQPPLSQQIRVLEAEVGLELLVRTTRRVTLTDAGAALLGEARRVLTAADSAERTMQQYRVGEGGTLRLGFVDSAAYSVMPLFLREYRVRWPLVRFELRSLSSDEQVAALREGSIDLGIARTIGDGHQITGTRFLRENLYVAVPSSHRLADLKTIRLSQLRGESFIGFDRQVSPTLYSELVAKFTAAGVAYDTTIEATEYTSILGLVAAGEGIAVAPASVRTFHPDGLRYVRIRGPAAAVSLVMLFRQDEHLTLTANGLDLVSDLFDTD